MLGLSGLQSASGVSLQRSFLPGIWRAQLRGCGNHINYLNIPGR
jgi:hypothetical protein